MLEKRLAQLYMESVGVRRCLIHVAKKEMFFLIPLLIRERRNEEKAREREEECMGS